MARVIANTTQNAGCRVKGTVFGARPSVQVQITLDRPCTWNGTLVPMRFLATTDAEGRFELWLPPTAQMQARDGGPVPSYLFLAEQVGSWEFTVPAQAEWSM